MKSCSIGFLRWFTALEQRGVSFKAVQELLGHESIEMTLRYSHLSPDVKRDAVKLLDGPKLGDLRETEPG